MSTNMSANAVTVRLQRVSQLRKLCLSLGRARPVAGSPAPQPPQAPGRPPAEGK